MTIEDLCAEIFLCDALIIRSGTKVTRQVFESSTSRLKVVGYAGIGIDNIDLAAATEHGYLIVNAPTANTIAAAEHGIALLTAVKREEMLTVQSNTQHTSPPCVCVYNCVYILYVWAFMGKIRESSIREVKVEAQMLMGEPLPQFPQPTQPAFSYNIDPVPSPIFQTCARKSWEEEHFGVSGVVVAEASEVQKDDAPSKMPKVEFPSSVLPGSLGIQYPSQPTLGTMQPVYNPAVPPTGWPVPPRPQPWFPQRPPVSVAPAPMGLIQQPLFPIQNVRPSVSSTTSPAFPPSLPLAPPGLTPATPVAVSQPLFPVVTNNNNIPTQSTPFPTPMLPTSIQSSSPVELKISIDGNSASAASNYHPLGIQGATPVNSRSYASGPNTGGPSIGPPPVIANKAPQLATNEVYLVWDDEAMSMEERRMSLQKYQVHDETSQMSSIDAAIDKRISASRLAGRMTF
ncbi:hypothetical protein RHSIM_Rhsim13G0133800 [Rhododendron simsii]|uniref:D-isomer specific 2-hydroxyacid dehydrogenase catalytic domain-containing protein n=1 Tax=Rhododendron simsii TaxID=118357 RepID=A0A834FYW0_RHOSS|nr:hypothetical protein RHSIM_RhsimUnG0176800 [Rhododendron simsii]KAF7119664.1 hypothetical protein RHSIM_Rhsim13G0133800 [Rhododendron simsii]